MSNNTAKKTPLSRSEKEERLRRAAMLLIARGGVSEASTRAIAEEAGLNLAALHYVFSTKDALFVAILEDLGQGHDQILYDVAEEATSARDAYKKMSEAFWAGFLEVYELQKAHYELTLFAISNEEYKYLAERVYVGYRSTISTVLTRFIGEKFSAQELNAFASAAIALIDGLMIQYLSTKDEATCTAALNQGVAALSSLLPEA
jgi:AcrR family transcriptional regulator